MNVTLLGQVPVCVVVDMEARRVVRVVIGDDEFTYDFDGRAVDENGEPLNDDDLRTRAHDIATEADEWPAWDFGW